MSDYDFASELLGKKKDVEVAPTEKIDFAAELLSGKRAITPEVGSGKYADIRKPIEAISSGEMGADIGTAFIGGIPTNKKAAIKYFAEKRGIPESRYVVANGDIAYQADDGKYYKEISGPVAGAAYYAPDIIEAMPGAVVGAATAPLFLSGPAGGAASIGLTAGTDVAANLLRQNIGKQISGQDISGGQAALAGLLSAGAQSVPGIAKAVTQRNLVRDIASLDRVGIQDILTKAQKQGIQLTPAEITDLSSLMAQQKVLGNIPSSSKTISDFYKTREVQQVRPAVEKFLADISPVSDVAEAGLKGKKALESARKSLVDERDLVTTPLYEKAFAASVPVDVAPVVAKIDNYLKTAKGDQAAYLKRTKELLYTDKPRLNDAGDMIYKRELDDRMPSLQNAKLQIDKMFKEETFNSIDNRIQGQLRDIQSDLIDVMGKDNPMYLEANAKYADMSKPINRFDESKAGMSLAAMSTDNMNQFASRLFESNSVDAINYAKAQIQKVDPDAWDAVSRAYMQKVWETAKKPSKTQTGLKLDTGNTWQNMLIGDEATQRSLRAALNPQQFGALVDLANVLEASARVKKLGSDTAFNQEIMKQMRDQAKGDPLAIGAKGFGVLLQPQNWGKMVSDWAVERRFANDAEKLANIVTDPNGIKMLKELRQMSPTSAKRWAMMAQLGVKYGLIEQKD